MASEETSGRPLSEAYQELEDAVMSGGGDMEKTIKELEGMTADVSRLGLFGRNEDVDELPTASLPYLLLPAFLGTLVQETGGREPSTRLEALRTARVYFKDYLRRLADYGLAGDLVQEEEEECSPSPSSAPQPKPSLQQLNEQRQQTIQRLRESQDLERKVAAVRQKLKSGASLDEEDLRSHLLEKTRWWALRATKDLDMIGKELPMLEEMARRAAQPAASKTETAPARRTMKPIILTRDVAQKAVFGAGYPSAYTMTVREYMDMTHHLHKPEATSKPPNSDDEDEQEENLDAVRALDEYKDFHRRGWGNMHNKG